MNDRSSNTVQRHCIQESSIYNKIVNVIIDSCRQITNNNMAAMFGMVIIPQGIFVVSAVHFAPYLTGLSSMMLI